MNLKLKTKQIIIIIINTYEKLCVLIKESITFIKYWATKHVINNSFKRYLNSFGYTILFIKFFNYSIINKIDTNLSVLVYKFPRFYDNIYDTGKHSIDIYNHNEIFNEKINNKCIMEIIDPACTNINNNIAKNVGIKHYLKIKQEMQIGYQICNNFIQQQNFIKSLFDMLTQFLFAERSQQSYKL